MKNCPGCKELTIYFIIVIFDPFEMYMKIKKMEHFLSKCSIFHNVSKSIQNLRIFSMSSKNKKKMMS